VKNVQNIQIAWLAAQAVIVTKDTPETEIHAQLARRGNSKHHRDRVLALSVQLVLIQHLLHRQIVPAAVKTRNLLLEARLAYATQVTVGMEPPAPHV
jgi:hypothetical protein